ncbi:hypothetical protein BGZ80_007018, partial [Entomortierella chlamydospora]
RRRIREIKSDDFKNEARFFSIYSPGRGFKAMGLRHCPASQHVMLTHSYPAFILPSNEEGWKYQLQGLVHLLQIRRCMKEIISQYVEALAESDPERFETTVEAARKK